MKYVNIEYIIKSCTLVVELSFLTEVYDKNLLCNNI